MSITTTVKSIQDIMRQDAGVDWDAQRVSQLVWMLFLKIFDDRETEYEIDPAYQSPIPTALRWRNWSADDEVQENKFPTSVKIGFRLKYPPLLTNQILSGPRSR